MPRALEGLGGWACEPSMTAWNSLAPAEATEAGAAASRVARSAQNASGRNMPTSLSRRGGPVAPIAACPRRVRGERRRAAGPLFDHGAGGLVVLAGIGHGRIELQRAPELLDRAGQVAQADECRPEVVPPVGVVGAQGERMT